MNMRSIYAEISRKEIKRYLPRLRRPFYFKLGPPFRVLEEQESVPDIGNDVQFVRYFMLVQRRREFFRLRGWNNGVFLAVQQQERSFYEVMLQYNLASVTPPSPIQSTNHQKSSDHGLAEGHILNVKEVYALSEDLRLVITLDTKALARVAAPQAFLQSL